MSRPRATREVLNCQDLDLEAEARERGARATLALADALARQPAGPDLHPLCLLVVRAGRLVWRAPTADCSFGTANGTRK